MSKKTNRSTKSNTIITIQTKDGVAKMNKETLRLFITGMCEQAFMNFGEHEEKFIDAITWGRQGKKTTKKLINAFMVALEHEGDLKKF